MAFVPRWAILMAGNRDNIATHSFYVTIYARILADVIQWKGPMELVMWQALIHDADETITGDIIGPAKKQIIDQERADEYLYEQMELRMPGLLDLSERLPYGEREYAEANRIVDAADKLDALLYLITEQRLGNTVVPRTIESLMPILEGAWHNMPADPIVLQQTWQTVMVPSINEHYRCGGTGL